MTEKSTPEKTKGGALDVHEVQPTQLSDRDLKTDDKAEKNRGGDGTKAE